MSDTENAPRTESDDDDRPGYSDAEPVSPDENPGDASKDLNAEAAEAYAKAGESEDSGD